MASYLGSVLAPLAVAALCLAACEKPAPRAKGEPAKPAGPPFGQMVIEADKERPRPPFKFESDDDYFLDQIQLGAFRYFWDAANPKTGMIPDRSSSTVVSVAGVGFQLAAYAIGAERGWVDGKLARERVELILMSLIENPENRHFGLFYHFIDGDTAGQPKDAPERVVSTIDTALLFGGLAVAASYFDGSVPKLANQLMAEADWTQFVGDGTDDAQGNGYISLGWKPTDPAQPKGEGKRLPYYWVDSGDEHRLVTFFAVAAPDPKHRIPAETYFRLRRQIGSHGDTGPMVWFPWSGSLFVQFFAHCFMDHAAMGPDDPSKFNIPNRPKVDWWENARRTARLHQIKAIENPMKLPGFGEKMWGLSASDNEKGYQVPHLYPTMLPMPGALPNLDYSPFTPKDDWGDGTVAVYSAGSTIMFDPNPALMALRNYREIKDVKGQPMKTWRDPATGGHGFVDSFNVGTGWVSPDDLAIDQGPLMLAIENARTGFIWRLFHRHDMVKAGLKTLGMTHPGE